MLLFRSLQHLHHICGKQICTAWSSCCWIWLIRACGFESTFSAKSRLLMILYKWTHRETLNYQVNSVHLSAPDKALIFSDELSGLRPVESLPLFTVADLICFLSALRTGIDKKTPLWSTLAVGLWCRGAKGSLADVFLIETRFLSPLRMFCNDVIPLTIEFERLYH